MKKQLLLIILTASLFGCETQKKQPMNTPNNNPLICNIDSGICETDNNQKDTKKVNTVIIEKPIKVIYFTDPICSSCWGIEPQLRKLKLEYGQYLDFDYRMGGLLKDWSYNNGGISKPSDVAHHWDEVSEHYDMPIDGDVWFEDPLPSSYPPSIAFKAAQMQNKEKAIEFLRKLRELLFLQKKNITKWEFIEIAANHCALNLKKLKSDYELEANEIFEEDLVFAKKIGVRGFPTLIFQNDSNKQEIIYGVRAYNTIEKAVLKLHPKAQKITYDTSINALFEKFSSLSVREYSEISGIDREKAEKILNTNYQKNVLNKLTSKNGDLYFK